MAARIKIVTGDYEQPEQSFVEAAHALLDRALAEGANVLLIAWESEAGVSAQSVPSAHVIARGVVDVIYDQLHPVGEAE